MASKNDRRLLFVYGKLMLGQSENKALEDGIYLGLARSVDCSHVMYDVGGHPALAECAALEGNIDGNRIVGELWDVSDKAVATIDMLSCGPDTMMRDTMEFELVGMGSKMKATFYKLSKPKKWQDCPIVREGHWRHYGDGLEESYADNANEHNEQCQDY